MIDARRRGGGARRPGHRDRRLLPQAAYPKPLHRQAAYRHYPVAGNGLPVTDRLADEVLSLPMHAYLDAPTQDRVIAALRATLGR